MHNASIIYKKFIDLKRLNFIWENLKAHGVPEGGKILDVGCGNGNISIYLGNQGYQVLGIDISEKTILKARSLNTLDNVTFKVSSAEELGKRNELFDAIVCSEVLEHLKDPDIILSHVGRLLKDDGILLVTVPNGFGPRELLVTRPVQYLKRKDNVIWRSLKSVKKAFGYDGQTKQTDADDLEHLQFFTLNKLHAMSTQHKFKIEKIGKSNFIEDVFPISMLSKKSLWLQKFDCKIADILPRPFTGGFNMVWVKK